MSSEIVRCFYDGRERHRGWTQIVAIVRHDGEIATLDPSSVTSPHQLSSVLPKVVPWDIKGLQFDKRHSGCSVPSQVADLSAFRHYNKYRCVSKVSPESVPYP